MTGLMVGLEDTQRNVHRLYRHIVMSRDWSALETNYSLKEPLLALTLPSSAPTTIPNRIRVMKHPSLDAHYVAFCPSASALSPSAQAFVPKFAKARKAASAAVKTAVDGAEAKEEVERKEKAAITIQRWLKRVEQKRARRASQPSRFLKTVVEIQQVVDALPPKADSLPLRSKILLGPFAHLHFALQQAQRLVAGKKTALQKDRATVMHLELERVMGQLTELR